MLSRQCEITMGRVVPMSIKTYSELITIPTFLERYRYLRIGGQVGRDTFGHDRYLNQILYRSDEWRKDFRPKIILRDMGCDLGCRDHKIPEGVPILIHHIDPITVEDVLNRHPKIFDPENVISTILNTHNAIHYGDESLLAIEPIVRFANDTCPWKRT